MNVLTNSYEAILFDHDDTLVQAQKIKWAHNKFIAKEFYDKELLDEEIMIHWGKPLGQMACALFGTEDIETAMQHIERTRSIFPKAIFPDTLNTLNRLRAGGKFIGVITATSRSNFAYDSEALQLPIMDYVQTFDDTDIHKPNPRVFEPMFRWARETLVDPKKILYVGDGLHDMHAAQGAGLQFIGVTNGLVSAEEFLDNGVVAVSSLQELIAEPAC